MKTKQVKDWMTEKVVTASSSYSLSEAYWLMTNNKVHRLPVVDEGVLVGMITLEDLRWAELPRGIGLDLASITDKLSKIHIRQLMTQEVKTISPEASLMDAARLMLKHNISGMPVLDENKLSGIITQSDIFRAFVEFEDKD